MSNTKHSYTFILWLDMPETRKKVYKIMDVFIQLFIDGIGYATSSLNIIVTISLFLHTYVYIYWSYEWTETDWHMLYTNWLLSFT